ncbi:MAG: DUF4270 family protein [Crocinitomicaceae bacterium]
MTSNKLQIISKRKVQQLSATFFIALLVLASCKKEETTIGNNLITDNLNVITTDTFTLVTYSEEIDSMASDETSVNMLGAYNDPVFGSVNCGIVTQVRLSSSNPLFATNIADVVVDSVVLGLAYTGMNFYGPLDPITVEVYEVTEDLIRNDQEYYTKTDPAINATNLVLAGTELETPVFIADVVVGNDTVAPHMRINLDPATIGNTLVQLNGNGDMATDEQFVNSFKGLYIKVNPSSLGPGQGSVLYFGLEKSLSKLTLYFHETGDATPKEYDFNINSSAARYNKITNDRSGTEVEACLANKDLGKNKFYMQGSSIWSVIEIPHIMNLNKDADGNEDRKIINKAVLILPVQDFSADYYDPSVTLFIARVVDDKTSDFILDYNVSQTLSGNTVKYDQTNKEYRFNMTLELQSILKGERENTGFRIYAPSFFASTVERVIFNGSDPNLKDRARLEITYTDY